MATALAVLAPMAMQMAASVSMPSLATLATTASLAGAAAGGVGALAAGYTAKQEAEYAGKQAEVEGDEALAVQQRKAQHARRDKELLQSKLIATAAAGGGSASDPTVSALMEGIERQGEYNELAEMYTGYSAQSKRYAEAAGGRARGKAARTAGYIGGASKFASGIGTMKGLYKGANPQMPPGNTGVIPTFNSKYGVY